MFPYLCPNAPEGLDNCQLSPCRTDPVDSGPQVEARGVTRACVAREAREGQEKSVEKDIRWIIDCGATDTMTFDQNDFVTVTGAAKSFIQSANGEISPVIVLYQISYFLLVM